MTVKAIETHYKGYRFRSRLEARWAVFFDTLGLSWDYEVEGYETPDGWYLPDFVISDTAGPAFLFEVKPEIEEGPEDRTDPRWAHVADHLNLAMVVARGLPRVEDPVGYKRLKSGHLWAYFGQWDYGYAFATCPWCPNRMRVTFEGRGARVCPRERHPQQRETEDKAYTYNDPHILRALAAAHSAQFEHGQSGAIR